MIKIIKGTYSAKRLTSKSDPFTLSAEEEKRLVALGVAEYVTAPEAPEQGEAEAPAKAEKKNAGKKAAKK